MSLTRRTLAAAAPVHAGRRAPRRLRADHGICPPPTRPPTSTARTWRSSPPTSTRPRPASSRSRCTPTHPLQGAEIKRAVQGGQAQIGEILLVNYQNEWQIFGADGLPFLADSYDESMKLYKAQKPLLEEARRAGHDAAVRGGPAAAGHLRQEADRRGADLKGVSGAPTARPPRASPNSWARSRSRSGRRALAGPWPPA